MSKPLQRDRALEAQFPFLAEIGDLVEEIQRLADDMNGRTTSYEIDVVCQRCGKREIRHTRDPHSPGEILGVCNKCMDG